MTLGYGPVVYLVIPHWDGRSVDFLSGVSVFRSEEIAGDPAPGENACCSVRTVYEFAGVELFQDAAALAGVAFLPAENIPACGVFLDPDAARFACRYRRN